MPKRGRDHEHGEGQTSHLTQGVTNTHLNPYFELLLPAVKECIVAAFRVLDATNDGLIGQDDFVKRAALTGDAGGEALLWGRLSTYFATFGKEAHFTLDEFSRGVIFLSLHNTFDNRGVTPANFRAFLYMTLVEVNAKVFNQIQDLLIAAKTPLPPAAVSGWKTLEGQLVAGINKPNAEQDAYILKALNRWLAKSQQLSMKQVYSSLDADGSGTLTADDFVARTPAVWEQLKSAFGRAARRTTDEISYDELIDGIFLYGLETLAFAPGRQINSLVDAAREVCGVINSHVDTQATSMLTAAGCMTTAQTRQITAAKQLLPITTLVKLEQAWQELDIDGDDTLTRDDFKDSDEGMWTKLEAIFDRIPGARPDGSITYDEFITGFVYMSLQIGAANDTSDTMADGKIADVLTSLQNNLAAFIEAQIDNLITEVRAHRKADCPIEAAAGAGGAKR